MDEYRTSTIKSLRDLADFLENNLVAPTPQLGTANAFAADANQLAEMLRAIGGTFRKEYYGDQWLSLRRDFGTISYDINIERHKVCKPVIVGVKIIPAQPERKVDVIEWQCGEVLNG